MGLNTRTSTTPSKAVQDSPLSVSEEELRAFARCSEFKHRGGLLSLPLKTALIEYAYIRLILDIMRNPNFDYHFELNKILISARKHLDFEDATSLQIDELIRAAALGVHQVFKILPAHLYLPVFGAFEYPVKVSDSILTMKVSSVLATKRELHNATIEKRHPDYRAKAIHGVSFSPFSNSKDMESDLVQQIKALTLGSANPLRMKDDKPQVRLHLFSASTGAIPSVNYTFIEHRTPVDYKGWAAYLEQPVRLIEQDYHYPLAPCPHQCVFKANCFPNPNAPTTSPETL